MLINKSVFRCLRRISTTACRTLCGTMHVSMDQILSVYRQHHVERMYN
jgi:hypothetical protein